jgi:hypothetical protein
VPVTRIKGSVVVTEPTEEVLAFLLLVMSAGFDRQDLPPIARAILDGMGTPATYEVGPGLEVETGDGPGANQVRLRWDARVAEPDPASLAILRRSPN